MIKEDDDVMQQYGFEYTDCDGKVYKKQISTAGATWHECLNDYVRFLESIFQYDIMDQVRIEKPLFLDAMYEHYPSYLDPWTGAYFCDDEDGKEIGNDDLGDW
jgi:hypothetical protein